MDVRVNIVGFAIDDEALKAQFSRWAELGGGSYLDAAEADALGGALDRALKVPFSVTDESGETVARGVVGGDPVDVPPGRYSIRVETARPFVERGVSLAPGVRHEIEVDLRTARTGRPIVLAGRSYPLADCGRRAGFGAAPVIRAG